MKEVHLLRFAATFAVLLMPPAMFAQPSWENPKSWHDVPEPKATKEIVYFAPADPGYTPASQVLDVYQNASTPAGEKAPVLLYIHGGGWHAGGYRPKSWQGFRPWLAAGFSIVNIDYRLYEVAPAPATIQDPRCALTWIKANAAKYNLDANRVVTFGASAGGHLALLAAVLPPDNDMDLPQCRASTQAHVVAVIDFFGPYHLEPDQPGAFLSVSSTLLMGKDPKPSLLAMQRKMSPSTYIRPGIPPVFLAHGDADALVPYLASVTAHKDLDKAGVKNQFDTVPGGGHGENTWPPEEQTRVELDALRFLHSVGVIQ